jgi:hypothetical protein
MLGHNQDDRACGALAASTRPNRRDFLKLVVVGGSLALVGADLLRGSPTVVSAAPRAAGATEALLLNCMDFRLVNEVSTYMNERGMTNQYDQVILAGASLAVATDKFPAWSETFWQHLEIAIRLHQIQRVIAMDHRDCGAYRVALGQDFAQDPVGETAIHTEHLHAFRDLVKQHHSDLEVELLLMALDGRVESIT